MSDAAPTNRNSEVRPRSQVLVLVGVPGPHLLHQCGACSFVLCSKCLDCAPEWGPVPMDDSAAGPVIRPAVLSPVRLVLETEPTGCDFFVLAVLGMFLKWT